MGKAQLSWVLGGSRKREGISTTYKMGNEGKSKREITVISISTYVALEL
jgi:hypothetical protein